MVGRHSLAETRLQLALDAGAVGTWTTELQTGRQVWDQQQREMLGVGPDAAPTRDQFLSLVAPEDHAHVEWHEDDLKPGARLVSEFRIRRRDGEIHWIAASEFVGTA